MTITRYSRRTLLSLGGAGFAAALLAACGDSNDEPQPSPTATPQPAATSGGNVLKLVSGWYRGRSVKYYDFGDNTKLTQGSAVGTAPIYAFIKGMKPDGTPDFVAGQHNIVEVKPGDPGYSDLWKVDLVTVPANYQADSIKTSAAIMSQNLPVTETNMLVNCPIVAAGTTLEGGEKVVQGWAKGEPVFYPDFGANPAVAIPIWAFITGMDARGMPQFVQGQMNIIDSVPGDPGYSAFWRVNLVSVPQGYTANTIKAADAVRSSGYAVMQTDIVVNCPVTVV
jgi:hypothetical protein